MSSFVPNRQEEAADDVAQINPYTWKPDIPVKDTWALSLDPSKATDLELQTGAFVIMSQGFGIHDRDGRTFSSKEHKALTGAEYYAKAKESWENGRLPYTDDWIAYRQAEESGDRAAMRKIAKENYRGEGAGDDLGAFVDKNDNLSTAGTYGSDDERDARLRKELESIKDAIAPEDWATVEAYFGAGDDESPAARKSKAANRLRELTERSHEIERATIHIPAGAPTEYDDELASIADESERLESELEGMAGEVEAARGNVDAVRRKYYETLRDEQRLSKYEKQLLDDNLFAQVESVKRVVSDEARKVLEMAQDAGENPTSKPVLDAFQNLSTEDQRAIAGVLQSLHYGRDTTLLGDCFRSFWDTTRQTVGGALRSAADSVRRSFMDAKDYRDYVERRSLLESVNQERMKEWGYLGKSVIGGFSTIPYMVAAGIPYAGTAIVMASAADQFQTEAVLNGVDVGSRDFAINRWLFAGAYAAVEKAQLLPFKPIGAFSRRQAYADMFGSLRNVLMVSGSIVGNTLGETVEEGVQGGIERVVESWGIPRDIARDFAAGFAQDFVDSFGTMALVGTAAAGRQAYRYRNGAIGLDKTEQLGALAQARDTAQAMEGHPDTTPQPLSRFGKVWGRLSGQWLQGGNDKSARISIIEKWGFTHEQAAEMDGFLQTMWKGASGSEELKKAFVGGNKILSAAELAAKTLKTDVRREDDGSLSVLHRVGKRALKLRFRPDDTISSAVDPETNDEGMIMSIVERLNRDDRAAGKTGNLTLEGWKALTPEQRAARVKGLRVNGNIVFESEDGATVGADALSVLSGRVILTDDAMPQTVFHEAMHGVLRILRDQAETDPEAKALQDALAKIAPAQNANEAVNEEEFGDLFQQFLTGRVSVVEGTDWLSVFQRWVARLLGDGEAAVSDLLNKQDEVERLFNLALTGDISPALKAEEGTKSEQKGTKQGEEGTKPAENPATETEKPAPAEPAAPSPAQQKLAALEAELAATPKEEIAKRQRLENRIAEQRKKVDREGGGTRASISGIFTGSAADYAQRDERGNIVNGPSLLKIGSGEGSQVYGWGLYGSNVRGVAEGYARGGQRNKEVYRDGVIVNLRDVERGSPTWFAYRLMEGSDDVRDAIVLARRSAASNPEFAKEADSLIRELQSHSWEHRFPRGNLYEQTFFTNRATPEETERHLLKWYEPVSEEQRKWILHQLEQENLAGETNLKRIRSEKMTGRQMYELLSGMINIGSERAASEFLARAGIDGVKYPVDSFGGKGVKDGDKAGWNYVSFRDDNIRVDHKWVDGEQRYQISGAVGAARLGIRNIPDAEAMERSGADRLAIWRETGWWRARDGEWRVEIPDFELSDRLLGRAEDVIEQRRLWNVVDVARKAVSDAEREYAQWANKAGPFRPNSPEWEKDKKLLRGIERLRSAQSKAEKAYRLFHDKSLGLALAEGRAVTLSDIIKPDSALANAYPSIGEIRVYANQPLPSGVAGQWNGHSIELAPELLRGDMERLRSVLAHEVQHVIQTIEGFSRGGDETMFRENVLDEERIKAKMFSPELSESEYADLQRQLSAIREGRGGQVFADGKFFKTPFDAYRHLAGEAEARLVQKRLNMTPEERAARPPWEDYDVEEERMLVRYQIQPKTAPHGAQKQSSVEYPDAGAEIKRFSIGKKRMDEYRALLARKRPDLKADEVLAELDKFNDPKKEKVALHWVIRGSLLLPQDAYKIDDALDVAAKAKVDPFAYKSPDELLLANKQFKPTARPIDPATVPELSDPRDEGDGIVSYEVSDTREGQAAMRRIIDTHWGEDANPWCLLARTKGGLPSYQERRDYFYSLPENEREQFRRHPQWPQLDANDERQFDFELVADVLYQKQGKNLNEAWGFWQNYSALPKRVAFKDGKLLAFMATDKEGDYSVADYDSEAWEGSLDEVEDTLYQLSKNDFVSVFKNGGYRQDSLFDALRENAENHSYWGFGDSYSFEESEVAIPKGLEDRLFDFEYSDDGMDEDGNPILSDSDIENIKEGIKARERLIEELLESARLKASEEWWDRKDESHPDLDWARDDASRNSVTPAEDAAYMDAVIRGDMETAQEAVNRRVRELGGVFHRGKAPDATQYIVEFADDPTEILQYGEHQYALLPNQLTDVPDFVKDFALEYFAEDNGVSVDEMSDEEKAKYRDSVLPAKIRDWADAWDRADFVSALWERFSSEFEEMIDNGIVGFKTPDGAVAWPQEKAAYKIADPVTYDDAGNVIPLSQRFNTEREDIRFSISSSDVTTFRSMDEAAAEAGNVARASISWNGPTYSHRSFATAYAARDRLLGIQRPDDDYQKLLDALGVEGFPVEELLAEADKVGREGAREDAREIAQLAGVAERRSFQKTVERMLRGSLHLGADVGAGARRAYEVYLAHVRRTAKGRDYDDFCMDLGMDPAALALSIEEAVFDPDNPAATNPATEPGAEPPTASQPGMDDDLAALLDGKAEDFGLTEDQLRERVNKRFEERTREIKERLERLRGRLDEWRRKEAERQERLAKHQQEQGKTDLDDDQMFDENEDETEAGAKALEDYESECVEEMPDFKAFLEECRREGLDLSNAAEFVAAVRLWVEDFIARETGSNDPAAALRDPVALARYRATMMRFLHGLADSMLDPDDGAAAKIAERMMQEIPSDATVAEIDSRARVLVAFIQRNGIRQTRKQLIRELRKQIKLLAIKGKKFDEMERDLGRKITGEREAAARYLYRILTWSDGMIAKESRRLHDIVSGREAAYRENGATDAELNDLARTDREVHRAQERLQMLETYGGLRKKAPADIKLAARAIVEWLEEGREAHEKRWNDWRASLDNLAERIVAAASARKADFTPDDPGFVGKLTDELTATVRQRLEHLFAGSGAEGQRVIDELMSLVYSGSERMRVESVRARRNADALLSRCVEGTGRSVNDFLKSLDELIPEDLNRALKTVEQPVRMTNGQALQLLASLEQTASYAANIEANGRGRFDRDGNEQTPHAVLLRRYFEDKPEMVRLLEGVREQYEERRGELSDAFLAVTGNPILSPGPLYSPVKMFMGAGEGFETSVHAWDPFGPSFAPRVKNTKDFDLRADIWDIYQSRTRETSRALAWGVVGMELRSALLRKEVQDAIARNHGKFALRQLVKHLTDVVSDGWQDEPSGFKALAQKLGNLTTYSALSWNAVTMLKQMTSIPAWTALMDGGYAEVFRNIASFDREACNELMDAPGFVARYGSDSFAKMFKEALHDPQGGNLLKRFFSAGMTAVQFGDFVPGIVVGTGVYKARKLALMRRGMEERQAREEAARITWGLIEECQQSSRLENAPAFLRRGGFMARQAAKFASSPLLQVSHEWHTLRMWAAEARIEAERAGRGGNLASQMWAAEGDDAKRWRRRFVNQVICNHVLMPAAMYSIATLFNMALGSEPPDEEEVLGDIVMQMISGPFGRVFLLGMIFDKGASTVARMMGGKPNVYDSTGLASQQYLQKVFGQIGRIRGDVADADWESVRDDFLKMLGQVSAPARYAVKAGQNIAGYDPAAARRERKADIKRERGE